MPNYLCPECRCQFHADDPRVAWCPNCGQPVDEMHRLGVRPGVPTRSGPADPLTGLPGRDSLRERLRQALAAAPRSHGVAVILLDLDDFGSVNVASGYAVGDRLLVTVADRLRLLAKPPRSLFRVGGDEFALLLDRVGAAAEAELAAGHVVDAMREIPVCASVGVAVGLASGEEPDDLLHAAELSMKAAKQKAMGGWQRFEPSMRTRALERLRLKSDLERALDEGGLTVRYQPKFELRGGRLAGVEALAYWQHPRRGLLEPGEFIPLAEEAGLVARVDSQVLHEACRQLSRWHERHPSDPPLAVSVNVSAQRLRQPDLVDDVRHALIAAGVAPACVTLEITERALVADDASVEALKRLKALGVSLAIDDFGTGYSCLGYLGRLPVDVIKLDKSFVDRIAPGAPGAAVANAIVDLGRKLGLVTVAEGIERQEQLDELRRRGCELGQGHLFARPLAEAGVDELLGTRRAPAPGRFLRALA